VTRATDFRWRRSLVQPEFYLLDFGMKHDYRMVVEEGDEAFRHYDP
jgi:hypothetical protein